MSQMMRAVAVAAIAAASAVAMSACSREAPKLVEKIQVRKVTAHDNRFGFNPRVDILFVIDDSGSMSTHQANLAHNIQLFTASIFNSQLIDYHIGVITSSMDQWQSGPGAHGRLVGMPSFVDRTTADGNQILAKNLIVGTSGSATEKFFEPVVAALTPPASTKENAGFYRDEAHLALVFITDTDDQSENLDADRFLDTLVHLKGRKEKILTYAAYIPTTDGGCDRSGEELPTRLERFFTLAAGKTFGLCDVDYGQRLAAISEDVVTAVARHMPLSVPPDPATIEVSYGSQVIPNDPSIGWTFDPLNNALIFGKNIKFTEQPLGSLVEVSFRAAEY
jgi:hypothetical protein